MPARQSEPCARGPVVAVIAALRSHLGVESRREAILLDRMGRSIELLLFEDEPCAGAVTMVTAGLSSLPRHPLDEELLMSVWKDSLTTDLQLVLEFVARQLAEGREPLTHGDVIGPAGPLVPTTKMAALYVCRPTYFPDEVATFDLDGGGTGRVWWLIPIHALEARLVEDQGAEAFEDILVREDPDLLSLERPAVPVV